jgi:hypothetical protein
VLPSFGDFTGCAMIEARAHDQVWVVAGETILRVAGRR